MIWYPVLAVWACLTVLYLLVQLFTQRDNSWIDAFWSLAFCIPNAIILSMRGEDNITPRMWLISIPVFIWGVRLSLYIGIRHEGEDYRYKIIRGRWNEPAIKYYIMAYLMVYMLQGVLSFTVNASVLYVNWYSSKLSKSLNILDFIGLSIAVFGLLVEILADSQLSNYLKNPEKPHGKFCKDGLWRYSRHPNYFGELVIWWGLWLIACSEEGGWKTIYAPLVITLLLKYVSGVPFPEKKYKDHPEFKIYKQETNCLALWPYNKNVPKDDFVKIELK